VFAPTPRISTYLTAVVGGGYVMTGASSVADGSTVPLRLFVRRSLAEHLEAEELFDLTRAGLTYFERVFDRYPFTKYDQLFVPEFSAGAMENPGCVTFTEAYVFRSRVTDTVRERRAETVLHEMAHMWFGDLVTMRWWDDLWLNESFATFMSVLAMVEATRWDDCMGHVPRRREDVGEVPGPAALDAPDRRRDARRRVRAPELRRHHLREGRVGAAPARRMGRTGRVPRRLPRLLRAACVGQHDARRLPLRAGACERT
jgi:hypothetical protein